MAHNLCFRTWTHTTEQMEISPFGVETALEHYTKNAEWDVTKFEAVKSIQMYECCKKPFSEVVYHLHIRRKTLYYMYTLVIPVTTLTALIAIGFCLPSNSGERIILSVTILVSMTVYLNIASKKLPVTSENLPLLSIFYFLLFIQIALSLAASTFVLTNFYRQNFSKPMPPWFKWLIFENLAKLLCGTKILRRNSSPEKERQGRKTVRFSDIITVNGSSLASVNSTEIRKNENGSVKSNLVTGTQGKEEILQNLLSNETDSGAQNNATPPNGSIRSSKTSISSQIEACKLESKHIFENILRMKAFGQGDRRHAQLLMNKEMAVLTNNICEKERKKEILLEWRYASMVIDRVFLIIFICTLSISLCFFLLHKIAALTS